MNWPTSLKNQFQNVRKNLLDSFFQPMRCGTVGLDIGSGSVKLVSLQKNQDGWTANAAAWAPIEPAQDQTVREENTVRAIRDCFSKAATISSRYAVCSLSGQEVAIRGFCFPPIPDQALQQAVSLEAQQVCALDTNHSIVDYQLVEDQTEVKGTHRKGYLVIGLQEAIDQKIQLAQQAQLRPILIDANSLAILNCLCQLDESLANETFAVLDVGHTYSYLVILGIDGIPFVRDLTCSTQQILSTLSQRLQKSSVQVRKELAEDPSLGDGTLQAELKNACGKLIADVLDTVRFYSLQQNTDKVSRIYLSGGLAATQQYVRMMTQAFPVQVHVFDLADKLHCTPGTETEKILKQYGPAMTVAAGLAMRTGE
jgi:type IV pilus assembly protein PilM